MTTARKKAIINYFSNNGKAELNSFVYEENNGVHTSWFNNGCVMICVNGDFTPELPVKKVNPNERYVPKNNNYSIGKFALPTLKELKAYKKLVGITAKTKSQDNQYIFSYQLCENVIVNYELLTIVVEMLGDPKVYVTNKELSPVYFENDNGEFAYLMPIRMCPTVPAYNILFDNYKLVDISDVPVGGEFILHRCRHTKKSQMDSFGNYTTEMKQDKSTFENGSLHWKSYIYDVSVSFGTKVWVEK